MCGVGEKSCFGWVGSGWNVVDSCWIGLGFGVCIRADGMGAISIWKASLCNDTSGVGMQRGKLKKGVISKKVEIKHLATHHLHIVARLGCIKGSRIDSEGRGWETIIDKASSDLGPHSLECR